MELPELLKKEIVDYCTVNKITDVDVFILKLVKQGFTAEKYGVTPANKTVEKVIERIIEVPVNITDTELEDRLRECMDSLSSSQSKLDELKGLNESLVRQLDEEKNKNRKDIYGE